MHISPPHSPHYPRGDRDGQKQAGATEPEEIKPILQQHHRKGEAGESKPSPQFPPGRNGAKRKA